MASPAPAKSQPLHNFSLPQLKWKKNQSSSRRRRSSESPPRTHQSPSSRQPSPLSVVSPKQSPIGDSESESGFVSDHKKAVEDDVEKLEKDSKSKIYIRLRKSKVVESVEGVNDHEVLPKKDVNNDKEKAVSAENLEAEGFVEQKTWNLRPRRPLRKQINVNNGGTVKIQDNRTPIRAEINTTTVDKKEKKQKFSIGLSREEVENDFLVITGSRPSRKPKKRAKVIQKQLDNVFPGMWLASITPDCYKVPDPPIKG